MSQVVWQPTHPTQTRMWQFLDLVEKKHQIKLQNYDDLHQWSIKEPASFWQLIADYFAIDFDTPPEEILNAYQHMLDAKWFKGAQFNFAKQLLKRRDQHPALISINEKDEKLTISYAELYKLVAETAKGLKELGVKPGDRVAAIMPNVHFTVIAMLATASLGAIWSSCSPDFGIDATVDRLGQIEPKILFACDGHFYAGKAHEGLDKIKKVSETIQTLEKIIICPILKLDIKTENFPKTLAWDHFLKAADNIDFSPQAFDHPLYILFSSGTTGKPKCIVHGAGGTLLQHLKELGLHTDLSEKDNLCFYTTCGWMMWNWMVSVLAIGATLTLYEGSPTYPNAERLFKLIADEKITAFGTSAKFISSVEKEGIKPKNHFDLSALKIILSTGSPLLPANYDFIYEEVKKDLRLCSISGGTDIISCFALGNPLLPIYRGELQCLGLGLNVQVFNEKGNAVIEQQGELVCTNAFPSMPVAFWNDPDKKAYHKAYFERFPGIWAHGDFAEITMHHGLIIYGRSDAVLNPGGVRIGTAEIYRQVEKIEEVLDSVVIGQDWKDDVRIVLFVKLRPGLELNENLCIKIRNMIKNNASPRHVPAKILTVKDIPRTLSGKIVELAVRQVIHKQEVNNLQSLANPKALDEFKNRDELLN